MKRRLWRLALAVGVVLCPWHGSSGRAQAPVSPPVVGKPVVVTDHGAAATVDGAVEEGHAPAHERRRLFHRAEKPKPPHAEKSHPVRTGIQSCLNNYGIGCWATHNTVGCTSLCAELTFWFGSCRAFFGEPCFPGPPPPPYPGWGPGSGCGCP